MAEFCLDCFNKLHDEKLTPEKVIQDYDLCEDCGEWKLTIVKIKKPERKNPGKIRRIITTVFKR